MSAEMQRLCHITKWEHFDGYGFDLHAEKGKPGQYIGKVDAGSPAEAAGLRQGDRIIEVNGASIDGKTHREVVDLIKLVANETKLLVVSDTPSDPPKSPDKPAKTTTDGAADSKPAKIENGTNNNLHNGVKLAAGSENITNGADLEPRPDANGVSHAPVGGATGGLNLNMTAAELRARLAARKKFDPKKETTMDFKKKFDMIQKL